MSLCPLVPFALKKEQKQEVSKIESYKNAWDTGQYKSQYEKRRTYQTATRTCPVVGKCGQPHGYVCSRPLSLHFSKQGTDEAVNNYLRSVHADGDGSISERNCEHRRIASQNITIAAIRVLDSQQLDRLQNVLDHIAYDKEYYMPERGCGMHR